MSHASAKALTIPLLPLRRSFQWSTGTDTSELCASVACRTTIHLPNHSSLTFNLIIHTRSSLVHPHFCMLTFLLFSAVFICFHFCHRESLSYRADILFFSNGCSLPTFHHIFVPSELLTVLNAFILARSCIERTTLLIVVLAISSHQPLSVCM